MNSSCLKHAQQKCNVPENKLRKKGMITVFDFEKRMKKKRSTG